MVKMSMSRKVQKRFLSLVIIWLVTLVSLPVVAGTKWPVATGWVNDYARVFTPAEYESMERIISSLNQRTGTEIAVVTIESSGQYTPKEYAVELFSRWGIGKAGTDNGLLILLSLEERRIEVETGYGLEGVLPDGRIGALLDRRFLPEAKQGRFGQGILAFLRELEQELGGSDPNGPVTRASARQNEDGIWYWLALLVVAIIVAIFVAMYRLAKGTGAKCPQCKHRLQVTRTVVQEPTEKTDGSQLIDYKCMNCTYSRTVTMVIPALVTQEIANRRGGGGIWFGPGPKGGSGGGSGWGGGGFGGFGGGRSGGGGSGRSW